jgi:hypothetical protein
MDGPRLCVITEFDCSLNQIGVWEQSSLRGMQFFHSIPMENIKVFFILKTEKKKILILVLLKAKFVAS